MCIFARVQQEVRAEWAEAWKEVGEARDKHLLSEIAILSN